MLLPASTVETLLLEWRVPDLLRPFQLAQLKLSCQVKQ